MRSVQPQELQALGERQPLRSAQSPRDLRADPPVAHGTGCPPGAGL